jgi:hypothetical protein
MSDDTRVALAGLLEECFNNGDFISPRTAMKCVDILYGAAMSRGSSVIEAADFRALKNVAGFSQVTQKFQENIERRMAEANSSKRLTECAKELSEEMQKVDAGVITKVIEWCMSARRLSFLKEKVQNIAVPDTLYPTRSELVSQADMYSTKCLYAARDAVRLPH